LNWNDLLQTEHTGRVRAGLKDGSILSVGSDSELRIVQHDSAAQQTSPRNGFWQGAQPSGEDHPPPVENSK
jgi:hypothetical protein